MLPWLRGPSLRARLTLIATVAAALILIPAAVVADMLMRHAVAARIWDDSLATAVQVAADVRDGRLSDPVPTTGNGIDLIEVVAPNGRIVAASVKAKNRPGLSPLRPGPDTAISQTTSCSPPHGDCVYVTAVRAAPGADSEVVYAGRTPPAILDTRLPELGLLVLILLLSGSVSWIAWQMSGRALRPMEEIRSELAEITPANTGSRVSEPPGDTEIARLARTANDALARLDRLIQQQRQFAADASHELCTPIAGIRAQLECARLHPEDTEEAVEAALRDTGRLEAIVADLLLLARIGTTPADARDPLDLGELVAGEINRRRNSGSARDVPPTRVHIASGVTVMALPGQLSRVVTNLLDNAERHAASYVRVEVSRQGDRAVLSVFNDGAPIPEEDRERIFERFYRRDTARSRSNGGTGLGLAIAREVVESHDGTIKVECDDVGVRFVVRLPLAPDQDGSDETTPEVQTCAHACSAGENPPT